MLSLLVATQIAVGQFQLEGAVPPPWKVVPVGKKVPATQYRIVRLDGITGIEGTADRSMALLGREMSADLSATPILCWRWRIDAPVAGADLRTRKGDDFAARVYVGFDIPDDQLARGIRFKLGLARRLTASPIPDAAINYVWDNRYAIGTAVPNAFTDRAHMIVLQSGPAKAKMWQSQRADVAQDFARAFPGVSGTAKLIAVAVDTDQTGGKAKGWFADIHFVSRSEPCRF